MSIFVPNPFRRFFFNKHSSYSPTSIIQTVFPFLFSQNTFPLRVSSNQSFFQANFSAAFSTAAFEQSILMSVVLNFSPESNGSPAIVGTAELFWTGFSNSCALHREVYVHEPSEKALVDLVVTGSVNID